MITFKMKALSIAVLGLAGLGMAGSVFAACPTDPAQPNGAWASKTSLLGSVAITSPGLNSTSCALQVSLNQSSPILAKAFVTDTSPNNESRYRARFYFDTTELTGLDNALKQVPIFTAAAATSPAATASDEVKAILIGGATPSLRIVVADSNQGSKFQSVTIPLPTAFGVNRFEFDLTQGTTGSVRYWLSAAGTATSDGSPLGTLNVNNSGWGGVKQASMGMFSASTNYRNNVPSTQHLYLDEFDSRRQTFIGQ
ncbi:MAG TPA: hypothetical protein VFN13_10495 [Rudaea sp.]|nr:hypothetical protein [Rudaea sp.]